MIETWPHAKNALREFLGSEASGEAPNISLRRTASGKAAPEFASSGVRAPTGRSSRQAPLNSYSVGGTQ